jgi:hypothetical protein
VSSEIKFLVEICHNHSIQCPLSLTYINFSAADDGNIPHFQLAYNFVTQTDVFSHLLWSEDAEGFMMHQSLPGRRVPTL